MRIKKIEQVIELYEKYKNEPDPIQLIADEMRVPMDEENLRRLAKSSIPKIMLKEDTEDEINSFIWGFATGYRKAKEEE